MRLSLRTLLISACLAAAGGWVTQTDAQDYGYDHGYRQRSHSQPSISLGFLILGDHRYQFAGDGAFEYELVHAFRIAGYRTVYDDGAVMIYYEGIRPSFHLIGCSYRLNIAYQPGCIILRPYLPQRRWQQHRSGRYNRYWRYPAGNVHRYPPYRQRWGYRSYRGNRGCRSR